MGAIIGGLVSGVAGLIGSKKKARREREAAERAAEQSRLGFDFARGSALNEDILGAGGRASTLRANALGFGEDPGAGAAALDQFKQSSGFQSRLDAGSQAITGNAATRGLTESGGTLKDLNRFGSNLAQGDFNQFINQLGTATGQGIGAGGIIAGAGTSGGGNAGRAIQSGGNLAANTSQAGFNDLASGIGAGVEGIFGRRQS